MILSDRLQIIADGLKRGETMADIGTDHGFLPLYLWENHISPRVIMTDISSGSLKKAEDNCKLYYPNEFAEGVFDLRLGSGIEVLKNGEIDCVVIAGMGGILMTNILKHDIKKTRSISKYILQPRNNPGLLRCFLVSNGFMITDEELVCEGRYICEIITTTPVHIQGNYTCMKKWEFDYPDWLIKYKNPLTKEYLLEKLSKEEFALNGLMRAKEIDKQQLEYSKNKILQIKLLLNKMGG